MEPNETSYLTKNQQDVDASQWHRHDTLWLLSLFGTAVGAGILFLPIDAGRTGIWPVILMTLLAGPMVFYSHRALANLVLSSQKSCANITEVIHEHFGKRAGFFLVLLYFLAIFPILLIMGVGATNTFEGILTQQLNFTAPPRAPLAIGLIGAMMAVLVSGERLMLLFTEYMIYPLAALLLILSIKLIPYWDWSSLLYFPGITHCITTTWLTLPVLVFSFTYAAAVSYFAQIQRRTYKEYAHEKVDEILKKTTIVLLFFVMFFVFSCVMTLSPEQLIEAKAQNMTILSYLSTKYSDPLFSYVGPVIAMVAIISTFFGHYLGAREGLRALMLQAIDWMGYQTPNAKIVDNVIAGLFTLIIPAVAIYNPSILKMIEAFSGPIITGILFLLPMYAIRHVPALSSFRGRFSNVYITGMGVFTVSSILYQLIF